MKRIFYFLLTVLLSIYSIHAQVTVPGTPVTPQVSTKDQTNWYLLMSTTNEGTGQNDRYCRFLQWNGTRLITNQYVDGLSADQITDNYRWCLEDAGNGNVYIRNAANNLRITVPSSITGNAGGRTNLTMTSEGSIFRWGLSKNEANAPSTCAENQYIFSYTGYTAGNNAYINSMNNAANESDNPFGITIWSGGIDGASGWFFYPAAKPERTVTVVSNNEDMGTVSIQGHGSATITTSENVTVEATAKSGYEFVNWTKDGGTEVSSDNPYTYSGKEGINLTANFREKTYPLMKRYYTNEIDQQNRYLKKVSYTVNDIETTIFEANKQDELPYTKVTATSETTSGAVIDKTATKITLPGGTTQFSMSFNAWQEDIDGYTPQLEWTKQVYYIDLNQDFEFSGTNEETPALGRIPNGHADGNNFGDLNGNYNNGWATNITLPADLTAGTYRMRVVYFEPSGNDGDTWNNNNVKTYASLGGKLRNGIAYDFDIVIQSLETTRTVTVNANPTEGGSVKITSPADITGSIVETSEPVTVVAEANPGYRFINWTNGQGTVSTNPEYTYRGINGVTLTANFSKIVNRYVQTISPSTLNGASGLTRVEISDKILGAYSKDGEAYDNRGNQLSVCAWVNYSGINGRTNQSNAIISHSQKNFIGSGYGPSFSLFIKEAGKMQLYSREKDSANHFSTDCQIGEATDIPQGWFHLVLTAKVENNKVVYNVYINGERSEKLSGETGSQNTFNGLPYLMDDNDCLFAFGGDMNCKFDDIMIWNTTIDDAIVRNTMKGFTDEELNSQTGLLAYYTFDDIEGTNNESANLITTNSDYKAQLLTLTGTLNDQYITASAKNAPSPLTEYAQDSERQTPRGGEKLYLNNEEITAENWGKNGDENFGYLVTSQEMTRLAYNGVDKVALYDNVLAVYHNGEPGLPTYVRSTDLESMTGAKTEMPSSYVVAGLDYTVQMPNVEKQWMPISLPAGVDLVAGPKQTDESQTVGLKPGMHFWYAEPTVTDNQTVSWTDIENIVDENSSAYKQNLNPGIISVPSKRTEDNFTFFTALNTPVVMRAYNQDYAAAQMPQTGTLKFVANPYPTAVTALQLTGETANMTVYRMNAASGNFDPVEGDIELKEFEPVFVFNNGGNPSKAPRYIGTKDVSGVLEAEAVYDVNIRGTESAVEVETFVPAYVEIYTVNGVMVTAENIEGTRAFNLQSGIYIVRTIVDGNAETVKVVVE